MTRPALHRLPAPPRHRHPLSNPASVAAVRGAVAVLLAVSLAGCGTGAGALPDKAALLEEVISSYRSSLQAVGSPDVPPAPRTDAPPVRSVASRSVAALPGVPSGVAALNGQATGTVARLLGPPSLRRAEGPAQIWLYTGRDCQLDLIFYPGASAEDLRVGWAAARAMGTGRVTEEACLREVAVASAGRPGA